MKIMLTRSSTKEIIDVDTDNVEDCYQNRRGTTVIKLKDSIHCIPIAEDFNTALQAIYGKGNTKAFTAILKTELHATYQQPKDKTNDK